MGSPCDTSFLEAAGYRLDRTLSPDDPGKSFLCTDERGKPVVMKRLDADCLHRDQLHPAIKDRLTRIRELPHPRVATLRGVERFGDEVCMAWDYLPGAGWQESDLPATSWTGRVRELIWVVDALHATGTVHGSLHAGNVIVTDTGEVWLTDVSPYLYTDPAVDIEAVVTLLRESLSGRTDLSDFASLLDRFDPRSDSLRDLGSALGTPVAPDLMVRREDHRPRWASLIAAALLVIACAVIAVLLRRHFHWDRPPLYKSPAGADIQHGGVVSRATL
jgi:hypothetical protein